MQYAPIKAEDRIAARFIPKEAIEERHEDADALVYRYAGRAGVPSAIAYVGTVFRPTFHLRYQSEERRDEHIAIWLATQRAVIERRKMRKAEKKATVHALVLGDIVYASWGYEQTNIDFYQVVRVVSDKTVEVRALRSQMTDTGNMSGTSTATKDDFAPDAPTMSRRARDMSVLNVGGSRGSATKWHGRPLYCSWYG